MRIIPSVMKITRADGKEYKVRINSLRVITKKITKDAPDCWVNWDSRKLEERYNKGIDTWIFDF